MMPSSDDVPVSPTPIRVELRSLLGKGSSVDALFGAGGIEDERHGQLNEMKHGGNEIEIESMKRLVVCTTYVSRQAAGRFRCCADNIPRDRARQCST